jgi:alkylhydroperoxidase family enzyme
MSDIGQARAALVARILEGAGTASTARRRAAFENAVRTEPLHTLVDKVARQAAAVTDADVAAVRGAGLTDDQIFELVVCAAIGQSTRQYEAALAALAAARGTA